MHDTYKLSQIAKKYDAEHRDGFGIERHKKSENDICENEYKQKAKCDCCSQTLFFRDKNNLYIKCIRCRNERIIPFNTITESSSELKL